MKALAAAFLMMALPVQSGLAATLTVHVSAIDKKGGTLRVSLYDQAGWDKDDDTPIASANVPAAMPVTTVTLKDIKPGVYGIKLFQDYNNNGRFDQNFLGLPLERYGFSRDAAPRLSQPSFDRTKFTVGDGDNEITIRLQ
ncbi:DUF2141 domain-containing protein [Rhizomicrobium electricum]|uniref:DUF2141 domain-containing protein n=1 Tax=Rhizomicrobium electricum TaxID=480070 RepID=A0ABP3PXP2_9PROT|nr:DUF2141 domain-containing protein [Rhizomicrobium electricum]NIJ49977.1 uncharacterized protein (DUF2141 family) [Rhizomicrobium electricum]